MYHRINLFPLYMIEGELDHTFQVQLLSSDHFYRTSPTSSLRLKHAENSSEKTWVISCRLNLEMPVIFHKNAKKVDPLSMNLTF